MDLPDRMKGYEAANRHLLTRRTPVIVRVDGKAFHTWTRGLDRPFDKGFMDSMYAAAKHTAEEMQGFKLAYIQSDEASFLLTDYDELATEPWLGNVVAKVVSISASTFTAYFNAQWPSRLPAMFDARTFNVPEADVANYFLWRAQDWQRNSLQMYAQSFFSHKELHKKNHADLHELLHGIGKNWATDLMPVEKNGIWLCRDVFGGDTHIQPDYKQIAELLESVLPHED